MGVLYDKTQNTKQYVKLWEDRYLMKPRELFEDSIRSPWFKLEKTA
jgi:hypothetical protein